MALTDPTRFRNISLANSKLLLRTIAALQFACIAYSQRSWTQLQVPDSISCSLPACDELCAALELSGNICPRCASSNVAYSGKLPGNRSCYSIAPGWVPGPHPSADDPSGCGPCLLSSETIACSDKSNPQSNRGYFGGGPAPRFGHSAVIFETPIDSEYSAATLMIVFGGKDAGNNYLNDVWAYCVSDCPLISFKKTVYDPINQKSQFIATCPFCRWRELSINQNFTDWITWKNDTRAAIGQGDLPSRPAGRMGHTAVMGTAQLDFQTSITSMTIFGGQSPNCSDYCADLWTYDILANTWYFIYGTFYDTASQLNVPTFDFGFYNAEAPRARWGHAAAASDNNMYIFGGHTEGQPYACCGYDLTLCRSLVRENVSIGVSYSEQVSADCPFLQDLWVTSLQGYQPFFSQLAVDQHCTQSSTLGTGVARLAADGATSGDAGFTLTNTDSQAWWQVDLGSICNISNITIFNRIGDVAQRLENFFVLVSAVPLASDRLQDVLLDPVVWNAHIMYVEGPAISVQVPTQLGFVKQCLWVVPPERKEYVVQVQTIGQYVRIQLSGTDYLSLAEVQVWGYPIIQEWQNLYGVKRWTRLLPAPSPASLPRMHHSLTEVRPSNGTSALILFGGRTKEAPYFLSELWLISLDSYEKMAQNGVEWVRLDPEVPGTGVAAVVAGPVGRYRHAATASRLCSLGSDEEDAEPDEPAKAVYPGILGVTDWCSGFVFIYGGSTEASQTVGNLAYPAGFLGDLWMYNVSSNVMTPINYSTAVPHPPRRSGHTMLTYDNDIIIYGGQGSVTDCPAGLGVCGDAWSIAASGPGSCPSNCSGHGACEFGFCVCETGFLGDECGGQACPNTDCIYDYGLHIASCQFCGGHGTCLVNGSCACNVGWGGPACGSLHCPGQCTGHGTCKLGGQCDCDSGFGGVDCFVALCPNNCTTWKDDVTSGTQGDCVVLRDPPCCSTEPDCPVTDDSPAVCVSRPPADGDAIAHQVSATCVCADSYTGDDCSQTIADQIISGLVS